jgi:hypothetical protein
MTPFPVPFLPEVIVNQEAPLEAVQVHPGCVVTDTLPVPPEALKLAFVWEIEYVHISLFTSSEYVLSMGGFELS